MISKETIREDLRNIRFYYARREAFEDGEAEIGGSAFIRLFRNIIRLSVRLLQGSMTCMSVYTFSIRRKKHLLPRCA